MPFEELFLADPPSRLFWDGSDPSLYDPRCNGRLASAGPRCDHITLLIMAGEGNVFASPLDYNTSCPAARAPCAVLADLAPLMI